MPDKALNLLGLMRRASAIQIGEENTGKTTHSGKAKLVLLARDSSANAVHRAEGFTAGRGLITVTLPYTKEEISDAVGLRGCSMAAVTDSGFADALMRILAENQPEEYSGAAAEIHRQAELTAGSRPHGKKSRNIKKTRED